MPGPYRWTTERRMARDHCLGLRGAVPAVPQREADSRDARTRSWRLRSPENRGEPSSQAHQRLARQLTSLRQAPRAGRSLVVGKRPNAGSAAVSTLRHAWLAAEIT